MKKTLLNLPGEIAEREIKVTFFRVSWAGGPGRALGIPNHDPKPVSDEDHKSANAKLVLAYQHGRGPTRNVNRNVNQRVNQRVTQT